MTQDLSSLSIDHTVAITKLIEVRGPFCDRYAWLGGKSTGALSVHLFSLGDTAVSLGSTDIPVYLLGAFRMSVRLPDSFDEGYALLRDAFLSALDSGDVVLTTAREARQGWPGNYEITLVPKVLRQVVRDIRGDVIEAWKKKQLSIYTDIKALPPPFYS